MAVVFVVVFVLVGRGASRVWGLEGGGAGLLGIAVEFGFGAGGVGRGGLAGVGGFAGFLTHILRRGRQSGRGGGAPASSSSAATAVFTEAASATTRNGGDERSMRWRRPAAATTRRNTATTDELWPAAFDVRFCSPFIFFGREQKGPRRGGPFEYYM